MRVACRGPGALGPGERSDDAPRHAPFQPRGGIGVPPGMEGGLLGPATLAHHRFEGLLERGGGQGRWSVPGREPPGAGPLALPVGSQQRQGPFGQGPLAALTPLALADPHQPAWGVHGRDLPLGPFPPAPPTGVEHLEPQPGCGVVDQGHQGADLLRTQHDRQLLALPGASEGEDRPRSPQAAFREAPDAREVHAAGTRGDLLLIQAAQQGRTARLVAELVGRAPIGWRQVVDGFEVARLGLGGEPPQLQVFEQTLAEGRHRDPPVRGAPQHSDEVDTHQEARGARRAREAAKPGATLAGQLRERPRRGFVQLLSIWKSFRLTHSTTHRDMSISSPLRAV
jgi:hypothetical protein